MTRLTEGDERQLFDETAPIARLAFISPAEEAAQNRADDRCNEPVALHVAGDHLHCLLLIEEAVGGDETL
jgi:hypothetical protein